MSALRLSRAGHCRRELAFEAAGLLRPEPDPIARARMDLGNVYEAEAIRRLRLEGTEVTDQQRPVSLCGVPGHIDGIARFPDGSSALLEVKSGSKKSVDDFVRVGLEYTDSPFAAQYYGQVQAYLAALADGGVELDRALVLYCERPEQQAELLAEARRLSPERDPIASVDVRDCRIERRWMDRSTLGRGEVAARLTTVIALCGVMPIAALREHGLREDGSLQPPCAWAKDGEVLGCDYRAECWGPLVAEKQGRKERVFPRAAGEW